MIFLQPRTAEASATHHPGLPWNDSEDNSALNKIRVIVADDHPFIRVGLRKILSKTQDIVVVGEAGNGEEALELVEQLSPDVLVLDVEMPRMNGIQVSSRLREKASGVRILVLSAYDDQQHILGMLEGGVAGYLTKEEAPDVLVNAVRSIAGGNNQWISKPLAEKIAFWKRHPHSLPLTRQQSEILNLLVIGDSLQDVAKKLRITHRAVEQEVNKLCSQLGAKTLQDLLAIANLVDWAEV
jgi:DNA-binding NarL/FixJ family response regulator